MQARGSSGCPKSLSFLEEAVTSSETEDDSPLHLGNSSSGSGSEDEEGIPYPIGNRRGEIVDGSVHVHTPEFPGCPLFPRSTLIFMAL
jgi:hypothetical protein